MTDADISKVIADSLQAQFPDAQLDLDLDGNRASITIISSAFEGLNRVKRQQAVYACINDLIQAGTLHAVTIQARTPDQAIT